MRATEDKKNETARYLGDSCEEKTKITKKRLVLRGRKELKMEVFFERER